MRLHGIDRDRPERRFFVLAAVVLVAAVAFGCSSDGNNGNTRRTGTVEGRLAAGAGAKSGDPASPGGSAAVGTATFAMSLDEVTVDLVSVDETGPGTGTVVATQSADATGAFRFEEVEEGSYSLRVNQPEFASAAYQVDCTEFVLREGETKTLVLPVVTRMSFDAAAFGTFGAPAVDSETGEILLGTDRSFLVVQPGRTVDVLYSGSFFHEWYPQSFGPAQMAVLSAASGSKAWIFYGDRIIEIDRSIFTDPAASETLNYDDLATRIALGDGVRSRLIPPDRQPPGSVAVPGCPGLAGVLGAYFSADESRLYVSWGPRSADCLPWELIGGGGAVLVVDLATLEVTRTILGQAVGYNPVSNRLFLVSGPDVLVVDATAALDVAVVTVGQVLGAAALPDRPETIVVTGERSTGDVLVPFVKVIDADGNVTTDQRASEYLGLEADPDAGAPSFDATDEYFVLGASAFRILPGGGFEPVVDGDQPSASFRDRTCLGNALARHAVDPVNRYDVVHGCGGDPSRAALALISFDRTNLPIGVRPSSDYSSLLLDGAHGRAILVAPRERPNSIEIVHYADPDAAALPATVDFAEVSDALVPPGATCDGSTPCVGTEVCAAETDTGYSGRCIPNPREPYVAFCGGFGAAACDDGFACERVNPSNPNSLGVCTGSPDRDYAFHGPVCGALEDCGVGMTCNAGGRCEPTFCRMDADCTAGRVCGLLYEIGRVCLDPGPLPQGAFCRSPADCADGACVPIHLPPNGCPGTYAAPRDGLSLFPMVCTSGCFRKADCPADAECVGEWPGNSLGPDGVFCAADVWYVNHAHPSMPYCRPSDFSVPADDCPTACADGEMCVNGTCAVGLGGNFLCDQGDCSNGCLPPATNSPFGGCGFSCDSPADCPWTSTCGGGFC